MNVDDSHLTDIHDALREAIEAGRHTRKRLYSKLLSPRQESRATRRRHCTGFRAPGFVLWNFGGPRWTRTTYLRGNRA